MQEGGQIELGGQPAVLGVADPATVAEQIEGAIHPVEDDAGLAVGQPVGGQLELTGVAAGGIECRHPGGITGEGVLDVGVDGAIEALQLPVARHPYAGRPGEILLKPGIGHLLGRLEEGELPVTIEQHP
ncbi:hypothetical protein D3C79_684190 [compost metagenome]